MSKNENAKSSLSAESEFVFRTETSPFVFPKMWTPRRGTLW